MYILKIVNFDANSVRVAITYITPSLSFVSPKLSVSNVSVSLGDRGDHKVVSTFVQPPVSMETAQFPSDIFNQRHIPPQSAISTQLVLKAEPDKAI